MISRCRGIDCQLREKCFRWLLPPVNNPNIYVHSMYSQLNDQCRFYWEKPKAKKESMNEFHANRLNMMIERINRDNFK